MAINMKYAANEADEYVSSTQSELYAAAAYEFDSMTQGNLSFRLGNAIKEKLSAIALLKAELSVFERYNLAVETAGLCGAKAADSIGVTFRLVQSVERASGVGAV